MKKHLKFIPLEISDKELDSFISSLTDKLYSEFWSDDEEDSRKKEIKARIEKNIHVVLESTLT